MKADKLFRMVKRLYCRFYDDDLPALGAQLTYYLVLAFFPFLIFVLTLIGYTPLTGDAILEYLSMLLPSSVYDLAGDIITRTVGVRNGTLLSFGMAFSLWAASTGVIALVKGINKAYDIKETRPFWKTRAISILFTLALTLVILLSLFMLVFGEVLWEHIVLKLGIFRIFKPSWDVVRFTTTFVVLVLVFVFFYRYMPNRKIKIREALPGSIFAAAGWMLVSIAFSYYISIFSGFANMYGSIGGIIILLLWLYWNSITILIGGEINATLAFGKKNPEEC